MADRIVSRRTFKYPVALGKTVVLIAAFRKMFDDDGVMFPIPFKNALH